MIGRIGIILAGLLLVFPAGLAQAQRPGGQRMKAREDEFLKVQPRLGDAFPSLLIYASDGSPFDTSIAKEHYSVWTFGCLTCPPSIWNIAGLEAVERDFGPKGVRFYFVYKSLAHPELAGNYIQPFTLDERLMQARQAAKQFGTKIPWVVDAMDNRLKHALGDRPNSQFIVDPAGIVVRKRAWSDPSAVRDDLNELVGPATTVTREEDLHLKLTETIRPAAPGGSQPRISREGMQSLVMQPVIDDSGKPFLAKLRPEADNDLVRTGSGKLYLGFHLDPIHEAHWNNLANPLQMKLDASEKVVVDARLLTAPRPNAASDSEPREFLLTVKAWPADEPLRIEVTYQACIGVECLSLCEKYVIERVRDENGGGARGLGAGLWSKKEFSSRMLADDRNQDRRLNRDEVTGLLAPHFDRLDRNGDQMLERGEIDVVTDWLNHHHEPGLPKP